MIKSIFKTAVISALISVFLIGCLPLTNEVKKSTSDHTDVDNPITGPLNTKDNVWPGKDKNNNSITYYINSIYNINNGGDLVIEEGAIVKFGPKGGITVNAGGSLEASGVVFTSSKDKRGREILAAGSANPFPGDWKQIYIYGGYASFYGCEFSYGGNSASTLAVKDNRAKCRVDNCLFRNNGGDKEVSYNVDAALKYCDNVDYNEENSITNCTFENNVWPLSIPAYFSLDGSNHFNTTDKPNEYNFIHINSYTIETNAVWATQDVPYIHPGTTNKISISNGASLTIKGGTKEKPTVVEFDKNGLTIIKGGTLYLENNIHFTNSELSPNLNYYGIYCKKEIKWYKYNDKGNITNTYTEKSPLLVSNSSMNIIIDNYTPNDDKYINGEYAENRRCVISAENYYEEYALN